MNDAPAKSVMWQRVVEAAAIAGIVGGVSVFAATAVMEERLDIVSTSAFQNATQLREVNQTLTDIQVEMAEQLNLLTLIASLQQDIAEHEKALDTIWPRLREIKERVQKLEPTNAERWRY